MKIAYTLLLSGIALVLSALPVKTMAACTSPIIVYQVPGFDSGAFDPKWH